LAVWRKPKSGQIEIIIDTNSEIKKLPLQLDELPAGFVIHPFADQADKKCYFLEAHKYLKVSINGPLEEENFFSEADTPPSKATLDKLIRERSMTRGEKIDIYSEKSFLEQVEEGIRLIQQGELIKIVPARNKHIVLKGSLDISKIFLPLLKLPKCFCEFHPYTWLGNLDWGISRGFDQYRREYLLYDGTGRNPKSSGGKSAETCSMDSEGNRRTGPGEQVYSELL